MRTMIISAVFPLMEFSGYWTLNTFKRLRDKSFTSNKNLTKTPSPQAYIDLHAGPAYAIHYRYSSILLHVGISFVYGAAMPLLYPIAFLAYLILHVNERLLVCYYYREPPAFDEKLTLLCIKFIKCVPLLSLPVAFWQLGNRQMFENVLFTMHSSTDIKLSGHHLSQALALDKLEQNTPIILVFLAMVIIYFFRSTCIKAKEQQDDEMVEDLADYYNAIDQGDKDRIIASETYYIQNFQTKTFEEKQFEDLKASNSESIEKIIMGVPTYRILDDSRYKQLLQFDVPNVEKVKLYDSENNQIVTQETDREHFRREMNNVYLALNLAFIH